MGAKRKEITGECIYGKDGDSTRVLQNAWNKLNEIVNRHNDEYERVTTVRRKTPEELAAERGA